MHISKALISSISVASLITGAYGFFGHENEGNAMSEIFSIGKMKSTSGTETPVVPVSTQPETIESLSKERTKVLTSKAENIRALVREIDRKIAILAKKNLTVYALKKYGNSDEATKKHFAERYTAYAKTDAKAELQPFYLNTLTKRLQLRSILDEEGDLFGAYIYLLLSLRNSGNIEAIETAQKKLVRNTLQAFNSGKLPLSFEQAEKDAIAAFFTRERVNPWSADDIARMETAIATEKIGPQTLFFRAYALAKIRQKNAGSKLFLSTDIAHDKQRFGLSCEANSLKDLTTYYQKLRGSPSTSEEGLILLLPSYQKGAESTPQGRIWGDPNKEFVGMIDGKQSVSWSKFTGYGIHADGMLPFAKNAMTPFDLTIEKNTFDPTRILNSLNLGNPVMFWYVVGADQKISPQAMHWKTPEGKEVTGYIGEHTGVIIGATFDAYGNIATISYYEGKSNTLVTESYEALAKKAKWFDEAFYVQPNKKSS